MELHLKPEEKIELTTERKKLIKKYIKLQEDFQKLYNKCLVNKFCLYYTNNELDIDALSEEQQRLLDTIVTDEQREEAVKDMPHHDVAYEKYLVAPFYIWEVKYKQDKSVTELEDEEIELIIEWTEREIEQYKDFIK